MKRNDRHKCSANSVNSRIRIECGIDSIVMFWMNEKLFTIVRELDVEPFKDMEEPSFVASNGEIEAIVIEKLLHSFCVVVRDID